MESHQNQRSFRPLTKLSPQRTRALDSQRAPYTCCLRAHTRGAVVQRNETDLGDHGLVPREHAARKQEHGSFKPFCQLSSDPCLQEAARVITFSGNKRNEFEGGAGGAYFLTPEIGTWECGWGSRLMGKVADKNG